MAIQLRDSGDPLGEILGNKEAVLIVGLGRSGIAAANLLKGAGCRVEINDASTRSDFKGSLADLHPDVRVHWGGHPLELFRSFPLVVVSPGVPTDLDALEEARKAGRMVIGELELAFRVTGMPWVAITGSNGKSTTTTLLQLFAQKQEVPAAVGGNLGTPATQLAAREKGAAWMVAEVSSFQLETIERFHPEIAVLLNISPDHLDRYPGMDEYVAAKNRMFEKMTASDVAVINQDDPAVVAMAKGTAARLFPFSRKLKLDEGVTLAGRTITIRDKGEDHRVIDTGDIAIAGTHNVENAMAAVAAGWKMGITPAVMAQVLMGFTGLPHRMELVAHHRGVPVYNDSKGTNVGATERSLEGMGGDVILIMGGKDKGGSYLPLKELVTRKVSLLVLIGEAAPAIEAQLGDAARVLRAGDMNEAVKGALAAARPGSEILFSPACSSFDMYRSFEERGDDFRDSSLHYMGMS
jgi:UDP-N-acetylmuramoylalanine--D-glutamate ligase